MYCLAVPMPTVTGCSPGRQLKLTEKLTFFSAPKPKWTASVTSGRSPFVCVFAATAPPTNTRMSSGVASPRVSAAHPFMLTTPSLILLNTSMYPLILTEGSSPISFAAVNRSAALDMRRAANRSTSERSSVIDGVPTVAGSVSHNVMKKLPNNATADSTTIPARFASDIVRRLLQSSKIVAKFEACCKVRSLLQRRTSRLQQVLLCVKISKKKCPTVRNVLELVVTTFSLLR